MVKQTIQIFARVKPTKSRAALYDIDDDDEGQPRLTFNIPRELADGFINNKRENYKFRFQKVFDQTSQQDDIFDNVAKPVIDNVLQGYNGTIFAYGQTGSGKTFTITGGAERYTDRGIIPRMLSYIFESFEKHSDDRSYTAHISYLEIYNDSGYDLLDPKHEAAKLEDLPKVTLMEDSDQNIHLKNLSVHQAANEEEALNLLFLGDTNRMIAETPMNQASTRSHCIFSVHLTSREHGSATIRRSKIHLVDLAGSERVSKSGVNGVLLTEAKYINLSLHYLEQVIISLSDKARQHIPYRNSMMTSVLRDSLGGNCMTTMIATCAIDKRNIDESISTCRFAQRVAMIKNDALLNEELDPKLMIAKLKKEIQQLREELALATGEQRTDELTEEDLERCEEAVRVYLADTDPEAIINVGADMRKIHTCFRIIKKKVLEKPSTPQKPATPVRPQPVTPEQPPPDTGPYSETENQRLKELVIQRDNEINILVNMLKKEKKRVKDASLQLERLGQRPPSSARGEGFSESFSVAQTESKVNGHMTPGSRTNTGNSDDWRRPPSGAGISQERQKQRRENDAKVKRKILGDMSVGRQEAFELFRRDYDQNAGIEENKQVLKQRYAEAKSLGENVNKLRHSINHLKGQIEHHRMSIAMQGLSDSQSLEPDELEIQMRHEMEAEKSSYKVTFDRLRTLKSEIEHLQHLLEKAKVKLMKDFELWWAEQMSISQQENQGITRGSNGSVKSAWQTPPPPGTMSHGHSQSPANPDSSQRNGKLGRLRGSMGGSVAAQIRASNSADGRIQGGEPEAPRQSITKSRSSQSPSGMRLTGDPQADADIMAFVKARQNILQQTQKR